MKRKRTAWTVMSAMLIAALASTLWKESLFAADHMEAPAAQADLVADIADVYAWHDSDAGTLTAIITFDGIKAPAENQQGSFDSDVLYTLNIDNNADNISDIDVLVRFGQNSAGDWGVQVENLPGATGTLTGAVETTISEGDIVKAYAGLFDDPFFFDLAGFNMTLETGTLSFDNTRDSFAVSNASAIVLEMDLDEARNGNDTINIWATTARHGG